MRTEDGEDDVEPGDLDDDLPPLVGEDGEQMTAEQYKQAETTLDEKPLRIDGEPARPERQKNCEDGEKSGEAARATAALHAAAAAQEAKSKVERAEKPVSVADAMRQAMAEADEPRTQESSPAPASEMTKRLIEAIARDDFDEAEDAILKGADVNVDCGAGLHPLHVSAMRGEMFMTELLIAHSASVNNRDMSGNTPLLYAVHFYRQHGRAPQLTSQLLFHRADPFYRVKDGKLAGNTALDLMEQACREPQMDESGPRHTCGMLKLAMDGSDESHDAITKVWMSHKSQNNKLYQVSSKSDKYDYVMKNINWETPENAANASGYTPIKIDCEAASILDEKFVDLKDYLFTDEGDKVKVYVTFPESTEIVAVLQGNCADDSGLEVAFGFQDFDLKLRTSCERYRLRIEPLFGSIDTAKCKHRASASSRKVTLTLAKRHANRTWPALQKQR